MHKQNSIQIYMIVCDILVVQLYTSVKVLWRVSVPEPYTVMSFQCQEARAGEPPYSTR